VEVARRAIYFVIIGKIYVLDCGVNLTMTFFATTTGLP
jgi:hypothetical protein